MRRARRSSGYNKNLWPDETKQSADWRRRRKLLPSAEPFSRILLFHLVCVQVTANVVNRLFSLVSFRVSLCRLGVCVRPVKCAAAAAVVKMRRRPAGQFQFVHGLGVRPGWRDVFSFEKNRSV